MYNDQNMNNNDMNSNQGMNNNMNMNNDQGMNNNMNMNNNQGMNMNTNYNGQQYNNMPQNNNNNNNNKSGSKTIFIIIAVVVALVVFGIFILNKKDLRFKGFFRTMIFLPCTTSLVAYAIIFRSLFANDGLVNYVLVNLGILDKPYNFLTQPFAAKMVIILALLWRWTGYNMVFFLSGLQNIEYSVYEAAKIDGASAIQTFFKITVPLLKPTILLTAIMSTNGTLQLFDESINLTDGGPANASISMSHYIYNLCFTYCPRAGRRSCR